MNERVKFEYEALHSKLHKIVPEAELMLAAELVVEIEDLKKRRNAIILGHNYMDPMLYNSVPDFKGDSLQLARVAATTDADVIVFCGVEFMAESAKILNPDKTVLVPSQKAGCSLAESISAEQVRDLKKRYPGVPVVTYINSYADVKAETDICCTSSNAAKVVNSLDSDTVIFIPDAYLAQNVARETGKKIIHPGIDASQDTMIVWDGVCEVHDKFTVQDVEDVRKQFPEVEILAHPECKRAVVDVCDFSGSTSAMIKHVQDSSAKKFMLLTECSMGDNIVAENPEKDLLRLCSHRCPYMAQITLEMTRDALKYNQFEIHIDEEMRIKAKSSIDRMLEIG